MPNITVAVSEELKRRMDAHDDINWSGVVRQAIERRLTDYEEFRKLTEHSTLTEKDANEMGRIVNEAMAKRYRAMFEGKSSGTNRKLSGKPNASNLKK